MQWFGAFRYQAITWTNVDLSSYMFTGINPTATWEVFVNLICKMCLEIKLLPYFPGTHELTKTK